MTISKAKEANESGIPFRPRNRSQEMAKAFHLRRPTLHTRKGTTADNNEPLTRNWFPEDEMQDKRCATVQFVLVSFRPSSVTVNLRGRAMTCYFIFPANNLHTPGGLGM